MIKFYCDNCLEQVGSLKEIKVPHYILNKDSGGYTNLNRIDTKTISLGLCQGCYNKAFRKMSECFNERLFMKQGRIVL